MQNNGFSCQEIVKMEDEGEYETTSYTLLAGIALYCGDHQATTGAKVDPFRILGQRKLPILKADNGTDYAAFYSPTEAVALQYASGCSLESEGWIHMFKTYKPIPLRRVNNTDSSVFIDAEEVSKWYCRPIDGEKCAGLFIDNGNFENNEVSICLPENWLMYLFSRKCLGKGKFSDWMDVRIPKTVKYILENSPLRTLRKREKTPRKRSKTPGGNTLFKKSNINKSIKRANPNRIRIHK